jgi:hypothetical protein
MAHLLGQRIGPRHTIAHLHLDGGVALGDILHTPQHLRHVEQREAETSGRGGKLELLQEVGVL